MYICYLDESGTPESTASTSHFVLLGVAISAECWRQHDREISAAKSRYELSGSEIHTAWLLRDYPEQGRVNGFSSLSFADRRRAVLGVRSMNLSRPRTNTQQRELLKNYKHTADYIHLGQGEREQFAREVAGIVASWDDAVLFADAHDKTKAPTIRAFDIAFEQVVTRFNTFLGKRGQTMGLCKTTTLQSRIDLRPTCSVTTGTERSGQVSIGSLRRRCSLTVS